MSRALPRYFSAPLSALLLVALAGLSLAQDEGAVFRFDEIEPRRHEYNDEYFLNIFNYRKRLTHRWPLRDAALYYDITAGSLRNDELYLEQRAKVRLPFTDHINAEFRFLEWEDYDQRFQRAEVELLFRVLRPDLRLPLTQTIGHTPPADGLFFGGTGLLDSDKEFADIGLVAGYRNLIGGLRVDAIAPDFFFNGKAKQGQEYTSEPYTLRLTGWLDLLGGDLRLRGWYNNDLSTRLVQPTVRGGSHFHYRQQRAGFSIRWRARHDLRLELEAWGERTRKRRRSPNDPDPLVTDDLNREAARFVFQGEWDVMPLLGQTASRVNDTVLFGVFTQLFNEITRRPGAPFTKEVLRRNESYAELGYVLALPSPGPNYRFGLRASAFAGFLSWRDVNPQAQRHRVTEKFLAKLAGGFEIGFRDDLASAFFQMTWRVDDQTFGGGNVQVQMRF
ncbi:MAG TPA: hypothetical protein DEA08_38645 [Planctomycetes bacterium]|nr:hypothetical protein [Planctomycetota bacterium]